MKFERRRIKAVAGRKLACFAAAFSAFLWAFCYGLPVGQSLTYGIAAAIGLFAVLWLCTDLRQSTTTVVLALLVAGAVFHVQVYRDYRAATALDGDRDTYNVELTCYPREGPYYTVVDRAILSDTGLHTTVLIYQTDLDLQPGDRLTVEGRLSLNRGEYFFSSMDDGSFLTLRVSEIEERHRPTPMLLRYLPLRISHYVREEIICKLLQGDQAALLASLLTGGTEGMSQGFKNDLTLSGVYHITSVSGLHMAILSGAMIALFGRLWGAVTALPLMVVFGMLTGMDPPVVRSILMLGIVFLAFAVDHENDGVTTVLTTLMLIGMADPCSIVSLSLQLSFAAVAGLVLLSEPIKRTLAVFLPLEWTEKRRVGKLLSGFGVSIAATLATLPLTMLHFSRISILSPLTNLAVLWLVSALMALGVVLILLWFILTSIARLLAGVVLSPLLWLFIRPITFIAELPFSSVETGNMVAVGFLAVWGLLLCVGYRIRPKIRVPLFAVALLVTVVVAGASVWQNSQVLTCTVHGDGMVVLQQGGAVCVLAPGGQVEDLPASFEQRLYDLGDLRADALVFGSTVGQAYAGSFSAETVYVPGNRAGELKPIVWYTSDAELKLGTLAVSAYGPQNRPYGLLVEWGGNSILYACGAEAGDVMPEGEVDLLVLDEVLACAAHQRRRLFARVLPTQIVACDAEAGHNYDYLSTANGPTLWLDETDSVTYTYKER